MLKWIIVGGGIQGTTMAIHLLKQNKVSLEDLAIIDPHNEPLQSWKRCTDAISMPYLRSPVVHQLDVEPFSLQSYAKNTIYDESTAFYGPVKRPSLEIFNEHCDHLATDASLEKAWVQGRVERAEKYNGHWLVTLETGQKLTAENLVLAIGVGEQPMWPDWATALKKKAGSSIFHIFDEDLPALETLKGSITIIGGGISSVHLAIKLSNMFPAQVTLMKRHSFRLHDFDSDPGWLGPKKQLSFRKHGCYQKRRQQILDARNKGSITKELHSKLLHRVRKGKLQIKEAQITSASIRNSETIFYDQTYREIHRAGTVILATGFMPVLPGRKWLMPMVEEQQLKCAECGFPIVTSSLQWGPNLYVTGALAELEIGPIARNISGARQAAERIVGSL
ncbi:MAG TPA: FAD/NAD(P)-binding protein [Planococcus sp. (in: firmicutes)]|nr:FAD/NAD(P)-binding protein [Planococcus sp. (in: firmicutes)]